MSEAEKFWDALERIAGQPDQFEARPWDNYEHAYQWVLRTAREALETVERQEQGK